VTVRTSPPGLVLAAGAYAAATAWASVVAAREDVAGEPLGITVPLSVPVALLTGWGAGIAAPWPMPVTAVVAAGRGSPRGAAVAGAIGAACLAGHAVEPVTWGRRGPISRPVAVAMALSLTSAAALAVTGWTSYRRLRR
jgi:hypothetical protein